MKKNQKIQNNNYKKNNKYKQKFFNLNKNNNKK